MIRVVHIPDNYLLYEMEAYRFAFLYANGHYTEFTVIKEIAADSFMLEAYIQEILTEHRPTLRKHEEVD